MEREDLRKFIMEAPLEKGAVVGARYVADTAKAPKTKKVIKYILRKVGKTRDKYLTPNPKIIAKVNKKFGEKI